MLVSHEYAQFATTRKALRVTRPRGQQRSTYWLQLPYKYSVPMMSIMVLLHWLASRSIFLVQIAIYDNTGLHVPDRDINACGFSPLAILLAFCLSTVMIAVLVGVGRYRRFTARIPAASSCSVAISAAAHPLASEPENVALLPLQYGRVPGTALQNVGRGRYPKGSTSTWVWQSELSPPEHVTFSSREVLPLESGHVYW